MVLLKVEGLTVISDGYLSPWHLYKNHDVDFFNLYMNCYAVQNYCLYNKDEYCLQGFLSMFAMKATQGKTHKFNRQMTFKIKL